MRSIVQERCTHGHGAHSTRSWGFGVWEVCLLGKRGSSSRSALCLPPLPAPGWRGLPVMHSTGHLPSPSSTHWVPAGTRTHQWGICRCRCGRWWGVGVGVEGKCDHAVAPAWAVGRRQRHVTPMLALQEPNSTNHGALFQQRTAMLDVGATPRLHTHPMFPMVRHHFFLHPLSLESFRKPPKLAPFPELYACSALIACVVFLSFFLFKPAVSSWGLYDARAGCCSQQ